MDKRTIKADRLRPCLVQTSLTSSHMTRRCASMRINTTHCFLTHTLAYVQAQMPELKSSLFMPAASGERKRKRNNRHHSGRWEEKIIYITQMRLHSKSVYKDDARKTTRLLGERLEGLNGLKVPQQTKLKLSTKCCTYEYNELKGTASLWWTCPQHL